MSAGGVKAADAIAGAGCAGDADLEALSRRISRKRPMSTALRSGV